MEDSNNEIRVFGNPTYDATDPAVHQFQTDMAKVQPAAPG